MDEAERLAYGRMNLKPWEFDRYTIPEWHKAEMGYIEGQNQDFKNLMAAARFVGQFAWNVHVKKGQQKWADEFYRFPWEKEAGYHTGKLTKDERKMIEAKLKGSWKDQKPKYN